jgi:Fe-S-cluster-containing dehydrogenase component
MPFGFNLNKQAEGGFLCYESSVPRPGLIINSELCIGCDACVAACRDEHFVPFDISFITVQKQEPTGGDRLTIPRLCRHCAHPTCLKACMDGAMFLDEDGVVQIDDARCKGCGTCVTACPHDALHVTKPSAAFSLSPWMTEREKKLLVLWHRRAEEKIPAKCDLCSNRRQKARVPACAAACRAGAIVFDDDAMELFVDCGNRG